MAPTEAQQRTDTALSGYLTQWNNLPAAQKTGPAGTDLKNLIELTVMNRNGSAAALDIRRTLDTSTAPINSATKLSELDRAAPRVDGSPEPAPAPPAPAPPLRDVELPAGGREYPGSHDIASDAYNAPPGDGRKWLPGNTKLPECSQKDLELLQNRDDMIEEINTTHFTVDPALAWFLTGANLPATVTNISTLGTTYTQATNLLRNFAEAAMNLESTLKVTSFEKLISNQNERIKNSVVDLTTAVSASVDLPGRIAAGGIAANEAFHQMREENRNQREAVAREIRGTFLPGKAWWGHLELPEVTAPSKIAEVDAAAASITTMTSHINTPAPVDAQLVAATERTPGGTGNPGGGGLPGGGGGLLGQLPSTNTTTPPAGLGTAPPSGAKTNSTDEIAKLLSQLGNSAGPLAQQAAQLPQQLAQQGAQLPQQAANAIRNAAQNPNNMLRQLRGADPQNAQLAGAKQAAATGAAADRAAATQVAYTTPGPAAAAALGAPGSPARPHQLDAIGKPVDKDGNGKVDNDAVPLSKKTLKPFDLVVPADGQNVTVKGVTDPRIGEMMLDMADTNGGKPLSVLEAAKAAGMDIPALGDPMDADKAKVGDAVIGDTKSGLYLGDDKVLTSAGTVENMDDVLGESGFVSKIPLPELPDNPTGAADKPGTITVGDASPPSTNTSGAAAAVASTPEPGPTPEPAKTPPPASAPAPAAAPAPVPAPTPAPAPAPAPAAPTAPPVTADTTLLAAESPAPATSTGKTPTLVPYEGRALGG